MTGIDTSNALEALRAALATDDVLEARLAPLYDPALFVGAAVAAMAQRGVALDADGLAAVLHPDPLGLDRFRPAPLTGTAWPGRQWLPIAMTATQDVLTVDWKHFAGRRLERPFFEEDVRAARSLPLNRLLRHRTPLSALADKADTPLAVPDGFVFHMSRCGSTLVAQMIAALPGSLVVSEAAPIDSVVQLAHSHPGLPIAERVGLLRAMVGALGRDRGAGRRPFVVKLDSWHMLSLPLFRLAFPDTPWAFLYRDPIEVLVSHLRIRGLQAVPGTMGHVYGIAGGAEMAPEAYIAEVLARVCGGAIEHHALGGGLLIDYADLPDAVETRILPHFGIACDAEMRAALAMAARRDAKAPARGFTSDVARKRREASPAAQAAAAIVAPVHRQLRTLAA